MSARLLGISLVAASAFFWSSAGLFVRLLDDDIFAIAGWRALFGSVLMWALVLAMPRRKTRSFGWPGVLAVALTAGSAVAYVAALKLTTVANVVAIYATLPLVAGAIGFVVMREPVERRVVVASLVALAGVMLVLGASPRLSDMLGNLASFVVVVTFAMLVVMSRRDPLLDLTLINALGTLSVGLAVLPFAEGPMPGTADLALLALFGLTTTAGAYVVFLIGSRFIPAAEAGLVGLIDVPLAPLWVWLVFGETPPANVLVGGAVILGATAWAVWPRPTYAA